MPSSSRPRFQRLALLVLGALVVVVAFTRLPGALARVFEGGPGGAAGAAVLYDETFDVAPGGRLDLDLGSMAVRVEPGSGRQARVVVEGRGRDAADELERRRFSARADRAGLVVQTDPPRGFRLGRSRAQFTVTVEVPRRFNLDLDLGSGSVAVGSVEGDVAVDTGSGSVRLADVDGRAAVDTGSGSVAAGRVSGDATIDTGSGSVRVGRVGGALRVDTGSGSVVAEDVSGRAAVETGSGSVRLALSARAPVTVDTGSGSVVVTLPRAGFDVDVEGGRVAIDEALGFRGERERDRARGQLGRGGPTVEVETGSGSVRLEAR